MGALVNAGVISSRNVSTSSITTDHLTTVRMGIYDTAFDEWHEDLDDNFVRTWNNFTQYECTDHSNCPDHSMHLGLKNEFERQLSEEKSRELAHGTHVAGTMCAEFNNGIGINGICIKNELCGYASHGPEWGMRENKIDERVKNTFEAECGFSALITSGVKVINYSMGLKDGLAYAASVDTGDGNGKYYYLDPPQVEVPQGGGGQQERDDINEEGDKVVWESYGGLLYWHRPSERIQKEHFSGIEWCSMNPTWWGEYEKEIWTKSLDENAIAAIKLFESSGFYGRWVKMCLNGY